MKQRTSLICIALLLLMEANSFGLSLNPFTLFGFISPQHRVKVIPPQESGVKAVIFDLDGVLFTTSHKMYAHIAPYLPLYAIHRLYNMQGLNIKEHYLEVLAQLKGDSKEVVIHDGKAMSAIMIDWLTGQDVAQTAIEQLENNQNLSYADKKLMVAIASRIFDPVEFINSRQVIPQGLQLLKALKDKGYKVYVLSNWDAQSFPILKEKFPEIMDLFDGFLISGDAKTLKPKKAIFKMFLSKFNLKAKDCIFIDDQPSNVDAAEKKAKIRSVLFDRKDVVPALKKLESFSVLTVIDTTESSTSNNKQTSPSSHE